MRVPASVAGTFSRKGIMLSCRIHLSMTPMHLPRQTRALIFTAGSRVLRHSPCVGSRGQVSLV